MAALKVSGGSTRSAGTIKLKIRPIYEATTCPYNKGPLPVEYRTKYLDILTREKTQTSGNYLKNHRTGRIYTPAVLVIKWDQDICIPKKKIVMMLLLL